MSRNREPRQISARSPRPMEMCRAATRGLLVILFCASAWAQTLTGVITGTVTDVSSAPIAGATVTVINADTHVKEWSGATNESGLYRAPNLPVGRYDIDVEAHGFKHQLVSGVEILVDQRANISVVLQLGQVSESITVAGDTAGQLQTESAAVGNTITPSQLQDLPLPSRSPYNLLALQPGVSSGGDVTSQSGLSVSQLSINGSRTLNSDFLIDGVSVVTGSTGIPQSLPPTDAIQEFKILASSYSAEYGRSSGAVVTMVTRAGSNIYHGSAYGYMRNEALDANNFFSNLNHRPRPEDRYNLFGAKLGGPLEIPKLYDGKNRTFYFVNYEGLKQASPYSTLSSIPYGAYAQGNFSASPTLADDPITKAPFPNNTIPVSRLDPAAVKILSLLPAANSSGTYDKTDNMNQNNYDSVGSSHPITNTGIARIDENLGDRIRVFGTFTHFNAFAPTQPTLPGVLNDAVGPTETTGYNSTFGVTRTWSPTFITEFRFGYFRNNSEVAAPSQGINDAQVLGIQNQHGPAAPAFEFAGGLSTLGTNTNTIRSQIDNNYQTDLTNSMSIRNHLLTFGGQLRRDQFDFYTPTSDVNGIYQFEGAITNAKIATGDPVNALADFLLGDITTANYSYPQPLIGRRNWNIGLFLQDDWKVRPNLTLNLGLRWDHETPLTMANNEYSRVDPTDGQVLFAGKNGVSDTLNLASAKLDFAPRIGVAYNIRPKTVIRAGYGIFFAGFFSDLGGQVGFPGYSVEQAFTSQGGGKPQPFSLSQGMPSPSTYNPSDPEANIAQFNSPSNPLTFSSYAGFGQMNKLPYAQEWNFGVQQELGDGIIAEVNYVGMHGVHLPVNVSFNYPPYNVAIDNAIVLANNSLATQEARPFPNLSTFGDIEMEGVATYAALQTSVRRQFAHNFMFISHFTWSKAIDDASGIYSSSQPSGLNLGELPQYFLNINKGLTEFNRTADFTTAIQYVTHGNKWVRNFQVFPMLVAHTGLPLYIGQTTENPAQNGTNQQRPDYLGQINSLYNPGIVANGTGEQYLLPPSANNFPLTPSGPYYSGSGSARKQILTTSLGNLGRDVVFGPGQLLLNVSVGRAFELNRWKEGLRFTIRMEAYNALNHTNFSAPVSSGLTISANPAGQPIFNAPTYGLITSAGQARFVQLAGRFDF